MRRTAALLLALGSPAAAWLKRSSVSEQSWAPPQETDMVEMGQDQVALGVSPRPTEAPKARLGRMLQPRMDEYTLGPETCGFVSSDGASFTCITDGATCTFQTSYGGCCEPNKDCNIIKTTCIDYDASSAGACSLPKDFHTLCCGTASMGSCFTWLMSTTGSDGGAAETFSMLDCSSRGGTGVLLDYDPAWARTHVFSSKSSRVESDATDSTSTDSPTQGASNDDENDDDDGGSSNIAAIAGGAAGGGVALAIIGAAIFFYMRRKKKTKAAKTPDSQGSPPQPMTSTPSSPPHNSYAPSSPGAYGSGVPSTYQGYPPSQGGYDPQQQQQHMSMYSQHSLGQQPYSPQQYPGPYPPQQQPGFPQGQYPPQQQYGYHPSSTASPPPLTTPSPGGEGLPPAHPAPANELQAVNPVGHETNRAELGNA